MLGWVGVGIAWRWIRWLPAPERVRRIVANAVFSVLLPALTFRSMLNAPLGSVLWKVPLVAVLSTTITLFSAWLLLRNRRVEPPTMAALLLAAAWGNVTYLGIPVLTATVGGDQAFVAVLYDFAASTPLLWTLGVGVIAAITVERGGIPSFSKQMLVLPPLWAAVAGLVMHLCAVALPWQLDVLLRSAGALVIPLMMFVLGLSLRWEYLRRWRQLVGVGVFKLVVAPTVAIAAALACGLTGPSVVAVTLEAGMPTMMLVLVVAERFALDTDTVAAAIATTTLASAVTLPLWWLVSSMFA